MISQVITLILVDQVFEGVTGKKLFVVTNTPWPIAVLLGGGSIAWDIVYLWNILQ